MSTETATKQQFRIKERKSDKNEQAEYAISQLTPVTDKLNGFDFWRTTLRGARLVVAPMVDQSELAWRLLSRRHKAELCYTPMYHASVFIRDGNYRRESLQSCDEDRPLIVQFCANKPETFLQAAKMAEDHCDAVDLNLGCPQSIARRGHYGAFLQDEWDLLHKMVSVCHKYLKVPITCKIRCFDEVDKTVRFAKMLENAGCQLLTIHGRTKEQKGIHTGLADWSQIKAVKDNLTIPVFANGNIQYYEDIQRCIDATGVEGVMSAEGNLHNPALFDTTQPQVWEVAEEYLNIVEKYPCPMSYIRGHLFKLFHHVLQVYMELRKPLSQAKKLEEFRQTVAELKEECQADVKRYKEDPASFSFNLPFPYWVCQPYERPKPDDTQQKEKKERKRPLEVNSGDQSLSINKMKKLVRNPNKKFLPKEEKFEKCKQCGNPKGLKCLFHFCKGCCRALTRKEILDCPGHKIWYKTAKQKWLSKQTAQVANTSTEVVSTSINKAADSDSPVRDSPTSALNDEQTDTGRINATSDHG